jgi:hypothetical protein
MVGDIAVVIRYVRPFRRRLSRASTESSRRSSRRTSPMPPGVSHALRDVTNASLSPAGHSTSLSRIARAKTRSVRRRTARPARSIAAVPASDDGA